MAYFFGAVFPFAMLVLGLLLVVVGMSGPSGELAIAGAVLLAGVLISFSIQSSSRCRDAADKSPDQDDQ